MMLHRTPSCYTIWCTQNCIQLAQQLRSPLCMVLCEPGQMGIATNLHSGSCARA